MAQKHKQIAEDTLQIIEQGFYINPDGDTIQLKDAIAQAVNNTLLYTPLQLEVLMQQPWPQTYSSTVFEVTNETTLDAARRLYVSEHQNIMCLNFASAKNPGGGFMNGAVAQEESIARASALYPCQLAASNYYHFHRSHGTCLYSHHMIYSPGVPVFKYEHGGNMPQPYLINIITSAAVNAGVVKRQEPNHINHIEPLMQQRIQRVLRLCVQHQHDTLVLGAWGCGVFQNNPDMIATLFKEALNNEFKNCFRHITFAIKTDKESMIAPFEKAFNH